MNDQEFKDNCQSIADALLAVLPEKWSSAWLDISFAEGSILSQLHCKYSDSEIVQSLQTDWKIIEPVVKIWRNATKASTIPLGHIRFTLSEQGKCDFVFEY